MIQWPTSALVLADLTASLADQTPPRRLRYYANFDLVILDEFGFDRIERTESHKAASLLYKLINARTARSTALVTNIDFEAWGDYLGDPPLAMAFLDRIVDGAIIRAAAAGAAWSAPSLRRRPHRVGQAGRQRRGWTTGVLDLYGKRARKRYKTFEATWRPAGGAIRVVLVDEPSG